MSIKNNLDRILNFSKRVLFGPLFRIVFKLIFVKYNALFLNTNVAAIGHLALDVDCFLKERALGLHSKRGILLCPQQIVSNPYLVECWASSPHLIIIRNGLLCFFLDYLRTYEDTSFDCSRYTAVRGQPLDVYSLNKKWGDRLPLINMPPAIEEKGRKLFRELFPDYKGESIALLHCRDSLYDKKTKNHNLSVGSFRNGNIESFLEILRFLKSENYICIRIGEYVHKNLEETNYVSINELSSDNQRLLECYLAKVQTLFLGTNSGPSAFATIWGKPLFSLNILPYDSLKSHAPKSVSVPKILVYNNKKVSVSDVFSFGFYSYHYDSEYRQKNIKFIDAQPQDVIIDFEIFFESFITEKGVLSPGDFFLNLNKKYDSLSFSYALSRDSLGLVGVNYLLKHGLI